MHSLPVGGVRWLGMQPHGNTKPSHATHTTVLLCGTFLCGLPVGGMRCSVAMLSPCPPALPVVYMHVLCVDCLCVCVHATCRRHALFCSGRMFAYVCGRGAVSLCMQAVSPTCGWCALLCSGPIALAPSTASRARHTHARSFMCVRARVCQHVCNAPVGGTRCSVLAPSPAPPALPGCVRVCVCNAPVGAGRCSVAAPSPAPPPLPVELD